MLDRDKHLKRAAVVVYPNGALLAQSEGPHEFNALEDELKALLRLFASTDGDPPPHSLCLEGVHYGMPYSQPKLVVGVGETTGFIAARNDEVVVIAVYEGPLNHDTRHAVQDFAIMAEDILVYFCRFLDRQKSGPASEGT